MAPPTVQRWGWNCASGTTNGSAVGLESGRRHHQGFSGGAEVARARGWLSAGPACHRDLAAGHGNDGRVAGGVAPDHVVARREPRIDGGELHAPWQLPPPDK